MDTEHLQIPFHIRTPSHNPAEIEHKPNTMSWKVARAWANGESHDKFKTLNTDGETIRIKGDIIAYTLFGYKILLRGRWEAWSNKTTLQMVKILALFSDFIIKDNTLYNVSSLYLRWKDVLVKDKMGRICIDLPELPTGYAKGASITYFPTIRQGEIYNPTPKEVIKIYQKYGPIHERTIKPHNHKKSEGLYLATVDTMDFYWIDRETIRIIRPDDEVYVKISDVKKNNLAKFAFQLAGIMRLPTSKLILSENLKKKSPDTYSGRVVLGWPDVSRLEYNEMVGRTLELRKTDWYKDRFRIYVSRGRGKDSGPILDWRGNRLHLLQIPENLEWPS